MKQNNNNKTHVTEKKWNNCWPIRKFSPAGGRYIASEKHVKSNFNNSALFRSCAATCGGDDAKPTPASLLRNKKVEAYILDIFRTQTC